MTHKPRHTEKVAAETVADLRTLILEQLTAIHHLTADEPTNVEIEEAQAIVEEIRFRLLPALGRALGDWTSSRRLVALHAAGAAAFRAKHPDVAQAVDKQALKQEGDAIFAKMLASHQINSPAEDAAMDVLESALRMVRPA